MAFGVSQAGFHARRVTESLVRECEGVCVRVMLMVSVRADVVLSSDRVKHSSAH